VIAVIPVSCPIKKLISLGQPSERAKFDLLYIGRYGYVSPQRREKLSPEGGTWIQKKKK
jgi:hypothetical protein